MHANAPLTPSGRRILCERIGAGRPVAHVAGEMGISRTTAYRWWNRWLAEGEAGLVDRRSRPHHSPRRLPTRTERRIIGLRVNRRLGPAQIGGRLGLNPSTVWRVLVRYGISRLRDLDPPTGRVIRRYEKDRPGELLHVDVKKLGRIPNGGGWRVLGKAAGRRNSLPYRRYDGTGKRRSRLGYAFVHAAVDDHSRVAYAEILPDEKAITAVGFMQRATDWFNQHGVTVEAVMTDNAPAYLSHLWADTLTSVGINHIRTRPYRPQTNGKVERFNRTLTTEWAYAHTWHSDQQRTDTLPGWIHQYNHHRTHTAIGNKPPISRVTNLPDQYN